MSAHAFNPYSQNQSVNSQGGRQSHTASGGPHANSSKNMRVIHHNATGKVVDKLTAELTQPGKDNLLSIYNQDFGGKIANTKNNNNSKAPVVSGNAANGKQAVPSQKNNYQASENGSQGVIHISDGQTQNSAKKETEKTVPTEERNRFAQTADANLRKTNYSVYDVQGVHDDVKRAYGQNPKIKHDEDAEYYETVRRLDVCGHCWTDQRKYCSGSFNPMHKTPGVSLYQKDFVKHPVQPGPVMKNDFYGTFSIPEPIDFGTTQRNDFKPWNAKAPERPKPTDKSAASGIPFAGKSGYKGDFINWGNMPVNFEKAPNNLTTIKELPFMAKTAYQECYGKPDTTEQAKPLDRDLWNTKKKSPISSGIPFLGMTTTGNTYKPYKVGGAPMFKVEDEYEPTEAYPGQFNSIYKQDYQNQEKPKCPGRVFMAAQPNPRTKAVK